MTAQPAGAALPCKLCLWGSLRHQCKAHGRRQTAEDCRGAGLLSITARQACQDARLGKTTGVPCQDKKNQRKPGALTPGAAAGGLQAHALEVRQGGLDRPAGAVRARPPGPRDRAQRAFRVDGDVGEAEEHVALPPVALHRVKGASFKGHYIMTAYVRITAATRIAGVTHRSNGRVRQAGPDPCDATGQHPAQAVDVEAAAEHCVQLVLQAGRNLVTAQVGARDRVVSMEAEGVQGLCAD